MTTRLFAVAAAVLLACGAPAADKDEGWTPLFNGKDLSGLKVQFKDADRGADPARTFTVKDGALIVGGKPTTVEKVDDKTVVFRFAAPNPAFILSVARAEPGFPLAPRHYLEKWH